MEQHFDNCLRQLSTNKSRYKNVGTITTLVTRQHTITAKAS